MIDLPMPKTVIEPFRIKTVEPLPLLSAKSRSEKIRKAYFNLFFLPADSVTFDFLTDSGTGSMSAMQWAAMMNGDESYAGSKSFYRFEHTIQELTGLEYVIPTHQGRAAESLLFKVFLKPGDVVVGNTHFDTTRANIEASGARALDMPHPSGIDSESLEPFKGNIDIRKLEDYLAKHHQHVPLVIMTITNNAVGGQPVSLQNLRDTRKCLDKYKTAFFIDAARFAENAYFIKLREKAYHSTPIIKIVHEMFALCDGVLMSAKKDGFGNIGGFVAVRSKELAEEIRTQMVLTEGFPTYGGLSGRDMEALAVGLTEILDEDYLKYRIRSTAYLGEALDDQGFKVVKPFGGHAVYIDAGATLPHIPALQFPGQSLAVAFYEAIGVRSVEVGSVMGARRDPKTGREIPAPKELLRLAIPRRVYTQSHVDYIIESSHMLVPKLSSLGGYAFEYQAEKLRHFTARFKRV